MAYNEFSPSSDIPQAQPDSVRDLVDLLMDEEFDTDQSEGRLSAVFDARDDVEDTLEYSFPKREEPRSFNRTPIEHLEMVTWERERSAA